MLYPWFPGLDVQAGLRSLVKGYFVRANRVSNKFSLHPLDQDYAYNQLPNPVDQDLDQNGYNWRNLELRAAEFYASLRKPEDEWKSITDLAPQLSEFEHRVRGADYDRACQLLDPVDFDSLNYLKVWGYTTLVAEMREKLVGRVEDPHLQVSNLGNLGHAYHLMGEYEQAVKLFKEGLALARETENRREEGIQLGHLGVTYRVIGQVAEAIEFCEQALTIARETDNPKYQSLWLGHLGTAYRTLGQFESSIELYNEALAIAERINDYEKMTYWLGHLGITYRALGEVDRSNKFHEQALTIAHKINSRRHEIIWLSNLAQNYYVLEQYDHSIELYTEALDLARQYGQRIRESYQLLGLGKVLLITNKLSEARSYCEQALDLDVSETNHQVALVLGIIILLQQDDAAAKDAFSDAVTRCEAILKKTSDLCEERFALATALVGEAVCDVRWAELSNQTALLAPALEEYEQALEICAAPGVLGDTLRNLELIRSAGKSGLDPVFELLKNYI